MFCCWLAEVGVQMIPVTCFVLPNQRDSFGTGLSGVLVLGEKKMKFLLSLLLIVGLVGCGDGASSPNGDAAEEAEPVEKSTEEAVRAFRNQLLKQKTPGIKLELTRGMPPFCRSPSYETIETNI